MLKILISEDDEISCRYLSKLIQKYGNCDIVADGIETVGLYRTAFLSKVPYQLVFLDVMLPRLDGVKVLMAIREFELKNGIIPEKRAKIVFISALEEVDLIESASVYGYDAFISKPFYADQFYKLMSKIV